MGLLLGETSSLSAGAILRNCPMCLMQTGKEADNRMEKMNDWRND